MEKLRIVLVETEGAVNLGFVARLAENFEADEIYLVSPRASLEEAKRYAARAAWRLDAARVVSSLEEALRGVSASLCTSSHTSDRDALRAPLAPWEAAEVLAATPGTVAIVFGRESVGLTRGEIALCSLYSSIPASPRYPSLNLSNAAAIYLYEVYKARRGGAVARGGVDEELIKLLRAYAAALASRLVHRERAEEVAVSLVRIASKSVMARREVENLIYLLSKACRAVEGCMDEVPRHLQPGD
ncbi:conserved hypothetical protein [Aeropyrum pernix]|uniref:tRNA/rRNA methyltransferase SpoU type domain-containing protein n=1 Tax=Aeropyrum pernix TaxID=56636 RepID=A0A401H862_AERPX|nr:RNA methyltransferase [Aeropyrum pernix]GBF08522.1 conserved hypothetical protein [Aeropyrum pernix]